MNTVPLLLGVVFSSIGLGYFIYGKKQQRTMPIICGIALMTYPYFIENTVVLILIGIILCIAPQFIRL
ncbi:MAG: amino acid transport protein [Acinetobacter sp.]|nr:amino acid transport protein [Acinetobacter sp.]